MDRKPRVAALLTCFNRRETTLACLRTLYGQTALGEAELFTYLVDDSSSDGTGEAVRREFPQVNVLQGDGQRFWCGGMRLAWSEAFKGDYDHYLWVNDDAMLYPDALQRVLATAELLRGRLGSDAIVAGAMKDPNSEECTYGGVAKHSGLFITFVLLRPSSEPARCDTIHGNFVLVPRTVALRVGNLSGSFAHQLGDFDYGLRAGALGISCWVTPGFVGTCARHAIAGSHLDATLPLQDRIRLMRTPSGPPPVTEWMIFMKRHSGWRWPLYWGRTLIRGALPQLWAWLRSRDPHRYRG